MHSQYIWFALVISCITVTNNFVFCNKDESFSILTRNRRSNESPIQYKARRKSFMDDEQGRAIGFDMVLNGWERGVNNIIMAAKIKEHDQGFELPYHFAPARHLFEVLHRTNSSDLFTLLKTMPKGGVLHSHFFALCSTDYMLSLTYKENLWQNYDKQNKQPRFLFSRKQPRAIDGNQFRKVSEIRKQRGVRAYDKDIRSFLTLYTDDPLKYQDTDAVWKRFKGLLILVEPLITFYPNFKEYFKQALTEVHADGVQYLEFRGILPEVYNLGHISYTPVEVVQIYKDITDEFIREHSDFIGCKFIYAPMRSIDKNFNLDKYKQTMLSIHKQFPNFVAGFDLVGQEDNGQPLTYFYDLLNNLTGVNFFFHAGETNWYGTSIDENLIDAVLLGTKRIGHGFAILKHPKVLETIIRNQIAIEVNPISNQVLKLVDDSRNHPAVVLIANGYPVVISSDYPSFWGCSPLTHDFYQTFLGLASKRHDLKLLKRLAYNSIIYSSMNDMEKKAALVKWKKKWSDWIDKIIEKYNYIFNFNE